MIKSHGFRPVKYNAFLVNIANKLNDEKKKKKLIN